MTNRKVLPLEHEHQNENDLAAIKEIEDGLDLLENNVQMYTPDLQFFEQLVLDQRQIMKKKFMREVAIFIVVALLVVSSVLFMLYQLPVAFFILQGIVTVFIIAYSTVSFVKQVNGT
ncbi:YxlC family protein [Bacillus sp. ISL-47]|uniref:YxlC family protein n=1 Tax=Bacillus sp. ISL-47 TaxID=2819130 RepID=UPI001BE6206D|nr:YxlC family protein [Bacillus sp. ISL-47]MBT2690771.1 YxlC family protein [Bacillus sp. ISL-47]MBT2709715.1 YxlC family protein [Pseudomonas sp. ISL-84]